MSHINWKWVDTFNKIGTNHKRSFVFIFKPLKDLDAKNEKCLKNNLLLILCQLDSKDFIFWVCHWAFLCIGKSRSKKRNCTLLDYAIQMQLNSQTNRWDENIYKYDKCKCLRSSVEHLNVAIFFEIRHVFLWNLLISSWFVIFLLHNNDGALLVLDWTREYQKQAYPIVLPFLRSLFFPMNVCRVSITPDFKPK